MVPGLEPSALLGVTTPFTSGWDPNSRYLIQKKGMWKRIHPAPILFCF